MIIVSQDGMKIYNFDNINCLIIRRHSLSNLTDKADYKIYSYDNTYRSEDTSGDILATYKTEERAKEVLQEIIKKYEESMCSLGKQIISFEDVYVYEMPEE